MKKHPNPLRVVAYIGDARKLNVDLLRSIQKRHELVGIITPFETHLGRIKIRSDAKRFTAPYVLSIEDKKEMRDVLQKPNADFQKWIKSVEDLNPHVMTVFNVNTWVPPELAEIPKFGSINFHPSPLPELIGPNPVGMACLEGREKIHGTIHRVEDKFDKGDIVARTKQVRIGKKYPIEIRAELERLGAETMIGALDNIAQKGEGAFTPQEGEPTYATTPEFEKRSHVNWNSTTQDIIRQYRALASHYKLVPP